MELREKIIAEIQGYGEYSARACTKAKGLFHKRQVTIEVPMRGEYIHFHDEGEAMHFLMKNEEEIRYYLHKRRQERAMKGMNQYGEYEYDKHEFEIRRRAGEEEWEFQERKRYLLQKEMRRLIHVRDFQWNEAKFEDMTSQGLMNLLVALKQGDE